MTNNLAQEGEFHLARQSQAQTLSSRSLMLEDHHNQHVVITSTTALVSIFLTAFTLFALYTGLQNNVTVFTA